MGFIQRRRHLDPYDFLVLMSVGQLGMKHPSLAGMVDALGNPMQRQSLDQRFTQKAVNFLERCFQFVLKQSVQSQQLQSKYLRPFKRIFIHDSSGWDVDPKLQAVLPGYGGDASKAHCKIQLCYEYRQGTLSSFEITSGTHSDNRYTTKLAQQVGDQDLLLADLGYFCLKTFHQIDQKGGFFVSRLLIGTSLYDPQNGQAIELEKMLNSIHGHLQEKEILLGAEKQSQLRCRLICLRLSKEQADQRRRKLRRQAVKKGRIPTQFHLNLCDWTLMVTNVPQKFLPAEIVRSFYSLRWQIELLFKELKSILQVHRSATTNPHRLKCELYGKLIAAVLIHRLHGALRIPLWNTQKKELSMDKFYKRLQERAFTILKILLASLRKTILYLHHEIPKLINNCLLLHQPSRKTTLQILTVLKKSAA